MIEERLLYRGKRTDNGEWATGYYLKTWTGQYDEYFLQGDYFSIRIDPATVEPVAVRVIIETEDEWGMPYEFIHVRCPNCKNIISQMHKRSKEPRNIYTSGKYCHDCGQRLDWSEFLKGGGVSE